MRLGLHGARTACGASGCERAGIATGGARAHMLDTVVRTGIRLHAVQVAATTPGPFR